MKNDIYLAPVFPKSGRIGRMIGIFHKVPRKILLGDFTQSGGVSALSALIRVWCTHHV